MLKRCKKPGCKNNAEPGSNFCLKHDLDGQGAQYLRDDSELNLKNDEN